MGFLEKIGLKKKEKVEKGVEKSRSGIMSKIGKAIAGKDTVDAAVLDDLEEILITSDVGVKTTIEIIDRIEARVARDKYLNSSELQNILREEIIALLKDRSEERRVGKECESRRRTTHKKKKQKERERCESKT